MRRVYIVMLLVTLMAELVRAGESTSAVAQSAPPDFAGYFPEDRAAATRLAGWWTRREQTAITGAELSAMVRAGFRNYAGDRPALLRWIARREIAGRPGPDGDVVALMYNAAGISESAADGRAVRHAAIHAGLSNVRPLPDAVLQFLVDVSLSSDRPDDLSRVSWAIEGQRADAEQWLAHRKKGGGPEVEEKADVLLRIWRGELSAHDWARSRAHAESARSFNAESREVLWALAAGDSVARREALNKIEEGRWMPLLGTEHLPSFIECATDPADDVRAQSVRLAAERWIHQASPQEPDAVALVYRLSADPSAEVRYHAVYNGLAIVQAKDEEILVRLLEMLSDEMPADLRERVLRGIRPYGAETAEILAGWRGSRVADLRERARLVGVHLGD